MKLQELLKKVSHTAVNGPVDRSVTGVAYDSRQVVPNGLFVAIAGTRQDGFDYTDDAVKRGAGVIVSTHSRFAARDVTHIQVADARRALADFADAFHGHPSGGLTMVGITGTNGKTTTAFMVRDVLEAAGLAPGLMGTVQYEIGSRILPAVRTTPQSADIQSYLAQMKQAGCRGAVMEVSSHALEQDRTRGLEFDVAVFTNLTRDHLDYHGTMESYYEAKRKLFLGLGRGTKTGTAVINLDDFWGRILAGESGLHAAVLTYGTGERCAVRATDPRLLETGSECTVTGPWGTHTLRIPLLGRFNLMNGLSAYTSAMALGLDAGGVLRALAHRTAVPGRLEEIPTGRGWRVFVDYAHTDDALANVLETLRPCTAGRLIVVFGCGGNRDASKRAPMGAVAARLADMTVLTSDNPRDEPPAAILEQIRSGFGTGGTCEVVEDRAKAIEMALSLARDRDVVLIAGKGHERTQEIRGVHSVFDDREVVRALLGELEP